MSVKRNAESPAVEGDMDRAVAGRPTEGGACQRTAAMQSRKCPWAAPRAESRGELRALACHRLRQMFRIKMDIPAFRGLFLAEK